MKPLNLPSKKLTTTTTRMDESALVDHLVALQIGESIETSSGSLVRSSDGMFELKVKTSHFAELVDQLTCR